MDQVCFDEFHIYLILLDHLYDILQLTFAIISHPDAGKTTLTEKLLLYGGAINQAGSVKGKQSAKHAVSDWMDIEKQRGISSLEKGIVLIFPPIIFLTYNLYKITSFSISLS